MSIAVNSTAFAKGWKRYTVMHKDRRVASVREDGTCTVYYPSFMPYNLWLENGKDIGTRVNNLNNFYYWCASRVLTLDRKYAKEILNTLGLKQAVTDRDRAEIAIGYRCLSLTDVHWVREAGDCVRFADIDLYRHSLSNAFVDVALRGKRLTVQNAEMLKKEDSAGDVATAGVAPKAWVRKDGKFWLYKDGELRDVKAELLASRIVRCFDVAQVLYEPDTYDGETASVSELITSLDRSIVSAEFMDVYAANHDTTLERIVKKQDPYGFAMMNIIDYLVGNTDRHWGNWGFWVDTRTNKPGTLHPLMDFNRAFTEYTTEEGGRCQTLPGNASQQDAAVAAVKAFGLNQIAEIRDAWFDDAETLTMFKRRMQILKDAMNQYSDTFLKGGTCKP